MSHQATTRRSTLTAPTSLECPLASLGRNSSAVLDSLNGHHHQPPYHHPLSSSPLDPQVYQMSRKSPDLSIDADDIIYTSSVSQQGNDDLIANIDEIEDDASAAEQQGNRCLTEMYERPRINSSSQSNGTGEAIVVDKTALSNSLGRSGPQRAPPLPSTQRIGLLLEKKFHCRDEPPSGVYQRSRESPDLEASRLSSSSSQQVGDQIDIHRSNDDDIAEDSSDAAHRSHVRRAEMYQLSRSSSRSSLEQGMKPRKSSTFELRSRHDMSARMCASPSASPTTAPRQQRVVAPPSQQMNYFVLEQLLQYGRSNERTTPSAYLLHGNNADTEDSSDAAGCGTGMRLTRHQGGRCSVPIVSSNGGRNAQYQLEKKMDTMYLESALRGLPLGSEASHFQNERYYLEDGLRNMCDYSSGNGRRSDSHLLHHRASSTSETSSSERYLLNRSNSPSKGFTSSNHHLDNFANSNGHTNTNNNSTSSSNLVLDPRFDHSKVKSLSDGLYNLGRFSPSLDQGYATLVSPSPTGHHPNTITTHSIVHHPPTTSTLTTSTARRHAESGPPPWNKKGPLRSGPYFDRLPDEAIVRVFNWLDSCELCSVARTCRRFEQVAWRPVLWKVIALKGEHLNGDKTLKMIIRQLCGQSLNGSCPEVERVMLSDGCRISDKGLQLVSRRCPELTHLQLQTCMNVTNQALMDVLSKCTNLQHLDVTGCSQVTSISPTPNMEPPRRLLLQYLDLTDCMAIDDVGLKTVVKNCPQLVYLYLRRCIQITDAGLKFVPSFCLALKELSVSDCTNITDFGLYELAKLGAALRYLSVAKCDRVSDAGLKVIARRCYKLRYLNARGCEAVSDDSITFLARSCPRLRALDIGKCDVSDAGLRALAESCPNLKKLSLRNCDMITDRGVQCIAYYCRGLQQLNIQDCQISIEGYRAVKKYCKRCIIEHTNPGFC